MSAIVVLIVGGYPCLIMKDSTTLLIRTVSLRSYIFNSRSELELCLLHVVCFALSQKKLHVRRIGLTIRHDEEFFGVHGEIVTQPLRFCQVVWTKKSPNPIHHSLHENRGIL